MQRKWKERVLLLAIFFQTLKYIFSDGQEYLIGEQGFEKINFYLSSVITSANFLFDEATANELHKLHELLLEIEKDHKNPEITRKIPELSSLSIQFYNGKLHGMEKIIKL